MAFFGKLRTGILLLCIMAALLAPSLGASAQAEVDAVVTADQLNVRAAPSTRATILTTLNRGAAVKIRGRNANTGWGYGTTENGALGWFVLQYVEVSSGNVRNLPVFGADAPTNPPAGSPPPASTDGGSPAAAPTTAPGQPSLPPPPPSSASVRGFELGGQISALSSVTIDAMRRAGMTWIKRQAFAGDGAAVGYINEAKANGFRILLSVIGDQSQVTLPSYHDSYASGVAAFAAAGADAIEVWNEQNLDREWPRGQINPEIYVQLLAKAYAAIKAANPGTLVISGALSPTGAESAFGTDRVWNDDRYAQGMARAGAGRYADCIGLHYNEGIISPRQRSGDPRGDNYPTRYYAGQIARTLNPFGGKKGCFTELGYLSPEGYGPLPGNFAWAGNTNSAQQAQWLAEAASIAASSGRIRLMIVFNVDFTYYGDDPQAGYAMIRPGGACPACDSLGRVMGVR